MSSAKRIELLVRNDVAKGHDKTLKRGVCVCVYIYIYDIRWCLVQFISERYFCHRAHSHSDSPRYGGSE